jgi:hypothetical protein
MLVKYRRFVILVAIVSATLIIAFLCLQKYQATQAKIAEQKLDQERKETGERIRAAAKLLAEQNAKNPLKLPDDPLAPPAPSDSEELANIKLWQQTPPEHRHKLVAPKQ